LWLLALLAVVAGYLAARKARASKPAAAGTNEAAVAAVAAKAVQKENTAKKAVNKKKRS
jgi:hypothetical protein